MRFFLPKFKFFFSEKGQEKGWIQADGGGGGPSNRASSTMGLSTPLLEKDEQEGGCAGHSQPTHDDGITRDTRPTLSRQQTLSNAKAFEARAREQNHPSHADADCAPAPVICGQQAPQTSRPPMSCLSCALHALPRCPPAQNSAAAAAPPARARLAQLQLRSSPWLLPAPAPQPRVESTAASWSNFRQVHEAASSCRCFSQADLPLSPMYYVCMYMYMYMYLHMYTRAYTHANTHAHTHTHTHAHTRTHTHTRQVVVPAGQPCAGETVTFTVPASAVAGQQIRVPLPRSHAMTKVAAGCFRVQLPGNFAPNQVLQVTVPPGFPQSGQSTRFKVPPHMCPGQYVDVPLPSASGAAPVAQGSFRVRLPASAAPGAMLKVSVPAGYVEAGREQTFLVPPGAAPGSLVDVPLPAGGPFQPGVYHGAQVHTQASPASEPLRGVPLGGGVGNNLPQRAEEPDTSYADPPPKNFSV